MLGRCVEGMGANFADMHAWAVRRIRLRWGVCVGYKVYKSVAASLTSTSSCRSGVGFAASKR